MKLSRLLTVAFTLAVVAVPGCIITSAQVLTHFSLPNPFVIDSSVPGDQSERVPVDLNVDPGADYTDNKDKLKGLLDVAIMGKFTNVNGPAGGVSVYIAPTYDLPAGGAPAPPSNAVLLWGPGTIGATGDVHVIGWDESAALFNKAGKDLLISEVKGDGQFTLYTTGTAGVYNIQVEDGVVALVLDAGK